MAETKQPEKYKERLAVKWKGFQVELKREQGGEWKVDYISSGNHISEEHEIPILLSEFTKFVADLNERLSKIPNK